MYNLLFRYMKMQIPSSFNQDCHPYLVAETGFLREGSLK